MWPNFGDLTIIYAVLTPAAVLYWHTTAILLQGWIGNDEAKLVVGFASCAAVVYLHDVFKDNAPSTSPHLAIYETAYDYMVTLSCLCYHLGCHSFYALLLAAGLGPIHVAIISAGLLIYLRGFRNVLSLPLTVNNDNSSDRYRPLSTLSFSAGILSLLQRPTT